MWSRGSLCALGGLGVGGVGLLGPPSGVWVSLGVGVVGRWVSFGQRASFRWSGLVSVLCAVRSSGGIWVSSCVV